MVEQAKDISVWGEWQRRRRAGHEQNIDSGHQGILGGEEEIPNEQRWLKSMRKGEHADLSER